VLVDAEELRRQTADLGRRMLAAQQKATELAGRSFNLDSPKQLQALLFDELKLPALVKTPTGAPSTNEEALEAIADQHELPRVILEYRGLAKLRSTYTEKLPEMVNPDTGRVHTSYHQAGAATGRLSSSDPNLQNIPIRSDDGRRIRTAFVAPPGRKLVACDYSQIELRIMAHLSEDPALLRAFAEGADIHRATAAEVFGKSIEAVSSNERRAAKAINFGLMYGMGAFGLARQLGIGRVEAQDYIALYFSRYPGVRDYMERTRQQARDLGYVETVFGRRLCAGLHPLAQCRRSARVRSAPRSMRRCRALPPTSSSARWSQVDALAGRASRPRADDPAGARRTGVRGRGRFRAHPAGPRPGPDGRRGAAAGAAGGGQRRRRQLGRGALRRPPGARKPRWDAGVVAPAPAP
jgi:DNA polymerase I-like protein with 3'-5' exonuclease and polymerase domains